MYRDWQSARKRMEIEAIRTAVREECESILESILEGKKKATFFPEDRKGEKWTETEDDTLRKKLCSFLTRATEEHRRSYGAISSRIRKFYVRGFKMKPTWKKIVLTSGKISPNCKCLICGKEFTFLGDGHFNMRLITCPTCNQQVWVPNCPNGCEAFIKEDKDEEIPFNKCGSLSRIKYFVCHQKRGKA